MITIWLTDAQVSALECSGVEEEPKDHIDQVVSRAWDMDVLRFMPESQEELFAALTELSNAEDAQAQQETDNQARAQARGAAKALQNLASKVLRAAAEGY